MVLEGNREHLLAMLPCSAAGDSHLPAGKKVGESSTASIAAQQTLKPKPSTIQGQNDAESRVLSVRPMKLSDQTCNQLISQPLSSQNKECLESDSSTESSRLQYTQHQESPIHGNKAQPTRTCNWRVINNALLDTEYTWHPEPSSAWHACYHHCPGQVPAGPVLPKEANTQAN